MQGLGWVALEELKWGDADHKWIKPGVLYTCGPGTYKLPSVSDIPLKFNVALLKVVCILTIMHFYIASLILKAKEWFHQMLKQYIHPKQLESLLSFLRLLYFLASRMQLQLQGRSVALLSGFH